MNEQDTPLTFGPLKPKPNVVAIVQARTESTRLPGKVFEPLGGVPCIDRVLQRIGLAKLVDQIVVAIPDNDINWYLRHYLRGKGYNVFCGHPTDLVSRVQGAALIYCADVIVDVTADCPMIDPVTIDTMVAELLKVCPYRANMTYEKCYVSNVVWRIDPDGFDCQVYTSSVLDWIDRNVTAPSHRQHAGYNVVIHLEDVKDVIKIIAYAPSLILAPNHYRTANDAASYRVTLDTKEDAQLLNALYTGFGLKDKSNFSTEDVIRLLAAYPDLRKINEHVIAKTPGEL
jgi:spore coat polysaccharide biosynthesis protein SpsF